jgi:hypothetical protein
MACFSRSDSFTEYTWDLVPGSQNNRLELDGWGNDFIRHTLIQRGAGSLT